MWPNEQKLSQADSENPANLTPLREPDVANRFGSSAVLGGIVSYSLSDSEKEEVRNYIKLVHPQSENSTIVLDSTDLPPELENQISMSYRDKDVTESESRSLLSRARKYMAAQNQNAGGQNVQ